MAGLNSLRMMGRTALVVLAVSGAAFAQGPWQQPGQGGQGGQGGGGRWGQGGMGQPGMGQPGMGGPGMGMPGMGMPPMGPGMNQTPVIAVSADSVYVIIGLRIFRLDPKTLAVLAQKDLPAAQPNMPGGPGMGQPGMGGPGMPGGPGMGGPGMPGGPNAPGGGAPGGPGL